MTPDGPALSTAPIAIYSCAQSAVLVEVSAQGAANTH